MADLITRYLEEFPDTIKYEKTVLEFWSEKLGKVKPMGMSVWRRPANGH